MREFLFIDILKEYFGTPAPGLVQGIGDDCAHLAPISVGVQLVTTDMLTHGFHFSERYISWKDMGWRSVAVNLSDLAASGADPEKPIFLFMSLAIPIAMPKDDLLAFIEGVSECSKKYNAQVAGGDSTATDGPFSVSITAMGQTDFPVTRHNAKEGDLLCALGFIGKAGAGFELLETGKSVDDKDALIEAYARPKPLLNVGYALAKEFSARAMIDISDGVLADAGHLAVDSKCDINIRIEKLPVPSAAVKAFGKKKAFSIAASFGDDYALLCALPPDNYEEAQKRIISLGSTIEKIGLFESGDGKITATYEGEPFSTTRAGYRHNLGR